MSEQTAEGACAGRVALVTGASQGGTGTAIAVRLAAEGAKVALTARNREGLEETAERIAELGGTSLVLPADLSDPDGGRAHLVERTEASLGPVDILVNSAAANGYKPVEKWTTPKLEHLMQINVWAPWELMTAVLPGMRERRRGWILNLTSFTGELPPGPPFPRTIPSKAGAGYGASKAALNRLTVSAASETEGQGIAVNALTPQSAIATRRIVTAGRIEEHWIEPLETMAEAALALCTCEPSQLTGRIAYSLQLLLELRRPVRDLTGRSLVDGWQPDDLPATLERQLAAHAQEGWRHAYDFARPSSPSIGTPSGDPSA
ncbi:MAG: SDR family oxidoreductase [Proteobacteria bacterium]|nr:SDR family oxidoreductase [Pseudomonadota bacterium]